MHHQPHIFLVNAHAKGRGGHNDLCLAVHEGILVLHLLGSLHLAVEGQGANAVAEQVLGQFAGAPGSRHIDNGRTVVAEYQRAQQGVFLVVGVGMEHRIAQVLSFGIRRKNLQL